MRVVIAAGMALLAVSLAAQTGTNPLLPAPPTPGRHLAIATSTSTAVVRPGALVSLFIDVAPNRGIHVYAPGAKDYRPITVKLDPQANVKAGKLVYPKVVGLLLDPPTGELVQGYKDPFRLTQNVTIAASVKPGTKLALTGTVVYQACDDKVCFVPASVPVSWTVDVR
jgi:hypothetical protein